MRQKSEKRFLVNREEMTRIIHSRGFKCGSGLYEKVEARVRKLVQEICDAHENVEGKIRGEHPKQPAFAV